MLTHTFAGVPPLATDLRLVTALRRSAQVPRLEPGDARIGVLGPDGRIYRVVLAHGRAEFGRLTQVLLQMGFKEHEHDGRFQLVLGMPIG